MDDENCTAAAPTDEALRDLAEDMVEAWGRQFPQSRFSGHTVETARLSVAPQEVVDLVAAALAAGRAA